MKLINYLLLIICVSQQLYGQITASEIADKTKAYNERNPLEKLYIDLDKSSYIGGETIWIKTYLVSGFYNQPSPLSGVIYLELVSPEDSLIQRLKIESANGIGANQIVLPKDLKTGTYMLTGYTNWMKNFDEEYFFQKEIVIYSLFEDEVNNELNELLTELDTILFFPEGGNLVSTLESRVAFKAYNNAGLPYDFTGAVVDQSGNQVVLTKSTHEGMGFFTFKPDHNNSYDLQVNGRKFPLPEVYAKGQTVSIINIPTYKELKLIIQSNEPAIQEVLLVGHMRGLPSVATPIKLQNGVAVLAIDKANFRSGVNVVSIFDTSGNPLLERLIFIEGDDKVQLNIETSKNLYSTREKVSVNLKSVYGNSPISSTLSCSVTNDWEVNLDSLEDNIVSYLSLTGDLPGIIWNPQSYFDKHDHSRWQKQDILMMVNGWRRVKWEDILKDQEVIHDIEQGIQLSGRVEKMLSDKGVSNSEITYILQQGNNPILGKVSTDDEGNFNLSNLRFAGDATIVLDAQKDSGKKGVKIVIDSILNDPFVNTPKTDFVPSVQQGEELPEFLAQSLKRQEVDAAYDFESQLIMLEGVEIVSESEKDDRLPQNVYGKGDETLLVEEIGGQQNYQNVMEMIQGRIAGVSIVGAGMSWTVTIRGNGSIRSNSPLILLDNVQVDINTLNSVPVSVIKGVEVYKGPSAAIFGSAGANGVLAFFTKSGEYVPTYRNLPNLGSIDLTGYSQRMEFYSPDYGVKDEKHVKPDYRSTVLWEPFIQTNDQGKGEFSFYTTDEPMDMTMIIEGLSPNGLPVYNVKHIKVR